jgi:hypothetical protein
VSVRRDELHQAEARDAVARNFDETQLPAIWTETLRGKPYNQ